MSEFLYHGGSLVQGFAPILVIAVTADVEVDLSQYRCFCVPSDCTYLIGTCAVPATLYSGDGRLVNGTGRYTFDTTMNIEVM